MNRYIREDCEACQYRLLVGCGTAVVEGKKIHFSQYGCGIKKCIKEEKQ